MQSAERGCSFCSLLIENLASSFVLNQSWLSLIFSPLYIKLQAEKDHGTTCVEGGGLAIYQITASVQSTNMLLNNYQLPKLRLEINVSADQGKSYTSEFVTIML